MKSLKFIVRLSLFVLILFAVAASTHAQQCQGYNPTMYQSPNPGTTSAVSPNLSCVSFGQTNTTTDYCGSLDTGGQLTHQSTVSGNGYASCTAYVVYCDPDFELQVTVATNQQDYNRFYNRAFDKTYTSGGCVRINTPSSNRQDYFQCGWYSCPPPPAPTDPVCSAQSCDPSCYPDGAQPTFCGLSPIILDLNGKGFFLTNAANGVQFDLAGNGKPVQMGWTASGANNAFLALPGADGLVHNGKQLFGNFTSQPPSTTPNGFAALAVYDLPANGGNGDGIIDARDAIFSSLRLWIDANHDGISQPSELHTLPSLGVTSISLNHKWDQRTDQYGNVFRYRAQVNPGDPTSTGRVAYDVFFVTLPPPTTKNILPSLIPADGHKCAVPVPAKGGMLSAGTK